jgi:cyclase
MEGLRRIGRPADLAQKYFEGGIDEIIFDDIVASLYGRNHLIDLVRSVSEKIFVPLCAGGGVRTLSNFYELLTAGADKVAINTQAVLTPNIVNEAAKAFGSQFVVVAIHAKRQPDGSWQAFIENGRQRVGICAIKWAIESAERGAGELLLISVDQDGTKLGFDLELIEKVTSAVHIPVVATGGAGTSDHIRQAVLKGQTDAVAISHLLHFNLATVNDIKGELTRSGIETRAA